MPVRPRIPRASRIVAQAPASRRPPLKSATALACLIAVCGGVRAQQSPPPASPEQAASAPAATPQKLQRVQITGSAIKRIADEGALPVQVLTRADITKAGVTTAAELMATVSALSNSLTDGVSIGTGGFRDQMGFNSANLRGLGTSSTLVLLNGRRMANFASPGDDNGVDLNNIPAAAIERVEVLLDGASALYGTDAIGGVINFITRKDYQGVQLDVYGGVSGEGGAGKRTASIAAGHGDLERDGFNVMGVLDFQKTGALRTSQRDFISDLRIPERLPHLLSSAGFPGNIRLGGDQLDYLQSQGFQLNGKPITSRNINLSIPNCQPPHTLYLPAGIGGVDGCTYDYMRDLELYPKTDKGSFLGRGVFRINDAHQAFIEASYTRSKSWYVGTSNRIDADLDVSLIPALAATGLGAALPDDRLITVRTRMLEAGPRASELVSTGSRVVVGMTGTIGAWDYDWGYNHSTNRVSDRDVRGYLPYDETLQAYADGILNPFGPSSAAGLAFLRDKNIDQEVRRARGTMDSLDVKATRSLMKLGGGDLAIALGAELRREKSDSAASDLLISDNILGDPTPGDAQFTNNSRKVWAAYGELLAPLTKEWELQFAVRHDHYQQVGSTTNPKIGLRYAPMNNLTFRASAGTGFRAPSMNDLYRSVKVSETATLPDPVCMRENDNDLGFCANNWETRTYANPNLKPEKSRQFSIGVLADPSPEWSMGLDYWYIEKRNLISTLGDDVILANLDKYEPLVHRYNENEGLPGCAYDPSDSEICFIELRKENRGKQKASGLDMTLQYRSAGTDWGRFGVKLVGTLTLSSKKQPGDGDPYISNLGRFVTDGVVQRWRHRLNVDWSKGPWSVNLANTFYSGYDDQNSAIDTNTGSIVGKNKVKAYSLWDLSGGWEATQALTVRAGVKNLFDTAPPFSNQAYFFISGYDPSYTDPRGRFFYLSASYRFK
ncbi:TonB-dependent receptor [Roseateles aquatilis]|uniref:TonB-dependent receptor n=1 Tax=Roseateles aquatilis TaxID=431061 RepID=A0A246JM93_9BURK|nr:TonB-dependent receptor [Roseateles aquatilis]OWQ93768.1 TonB-dependent receptor [Roseateles aquatilis]